jgi:hypothetical protein
MLPLDSMLVPKYPMLALQRSQAMLLSSYLGFEQPKIEEFAMQLEKVLSF